MTSPTKPEVQYISLAFSSDEDRGNIYRKFCEVWDAVYVRYASEQTYWLHTDRQTNTLFAILLTFPEGGG